MVGDNLLTDIAFGHKAKFTTLLVESGMHSRNDVERICGNPSTNTMSHNPQHNHGCRLHTGGNANTAANMESSSAVNEAGACVIRKSLDSPVDCSSVKAVEVIRERRRHEREDLRIRRRSEREESYERRLRLRDEDEEHRRAVRQEIASRILQLKAEEESIKERLRVERKEFKERQKHEREESQVSIRPSPPSVSHEECAVCATCDLVLVEVHCM